MHVISRKMENRNEQQYDQAIETINWLVDVVGDDETHPLYDLGDTLSTLIELYEEQHYPVSDVTGVQVLQFFMAEHQLEPSDLPELGGPARVTDLLEGRQALDVRDIRVLSARFGVSSATFVGTSTTWAEMHETWWGYDMLEYMSSMSPKLADADKTLFLKLIDVLELPKADGDKKLKELEAWLATMPPE